MRAFVKATIFVVALLGLTSCTRGIEDKNPSQSATQTATKSSRRRIISLSPSITETIYAFGGGASLLGVDRYSAQIPAANRDLKSKLISRFGDAMNPAQEAIFAAKPEVILVEGDSRAIALAALGPEVVALPSTNLAEIEEMWRRVGEVLGAGEAARVAQATLTDSLTKLKLARAPRVLMSYSTPGEGTLYCVGANSYQSEILSRLGGHNVLAELSITTPTPQVSLEDLLGYDPDIVITILASKPEGGALSRWQGLSSLRAVKEQQIYELAGSAMTFYGPESLAAFIKALREVLESWAKR